MSPVPSTRLLRACTFVVIACVVAGATASAAGAAVPRLRIPQIRSFEIPRLPLAPIKIPKALDAIKYGIDDEQLIAVLDDLGERLRSDVDATATRVGATTDDAARIKACAGASLKGAGESYRDEVRAAYQAGTELSAPDFTEVSAGAKACLEQQYPQVPNAVWRLSQELANHAATRAQAAIEASQSSAIGAEWMIVAGDEIRVDDAVIDTESEPEPEPEPAGGSETDEPGSDGGVPAGLIGGGIAIVVIGGLVVAVRSRRTPDGTP